MRNSITPSATSNALRFTAQRPAQPDLQFPFSQSADERAQLLRFFRRNILESRAPSLIMLCCSPIAERGFLSGVKNKYGNGQVFARRLRAEGEFGHVEKMRFNCRGFADGFVRGVGGESQR